MIQQLLLLLTLVSVGTGNEMVTCTSVIKLQNVQRGVRLHSHEVKYGSGSGQQSVTGQFCRAIDFLKFDFYSLLTSNDR